MSQGEDQVLHFTIELDAEDLKDIRGVCRSQPGPKKVFQIDLAKNLAIAGIFVVLMISGLWWPIIAADVILFAAIAASRAPRRAVQLESFRRSGAGAVTVDRFGLTFADDKRTPWSRILKTIETPEQFILLTSELTGFIIPKRNLSTAADVDTLRSLSTGTLGD